MVKASSSTTLWTIVMNGSRNYFKIKTKNPIKTLEKIFSNPNYEGYVAMRKSGFAMWIYINDEEFDELKAGNKVRLTTTTIPFNGYGRGILEGWSTITLSLEDLSK